MPELQREAKPTVQCVDEPAQVIRLHLKECRETAQVGSAAVGARSGEDTATSCCDVFNVKIASQKRPASDVRYGPHAGDIRGGDDVTEDFAIGALARAHR